MKIKLFPWWSCSHSTTERFKKQFIGSYFNHPDITFTINEDYDYAVIFGFTKEKIKTDKDHTIVFFQEPFWSSNWDREAYKISNRVFCPSKKLYGNYDEFIEHPTLMFYGGHGDEYFDIDTILNYNKTNKNKNVSCVVTNRSYSPLTGCNTHSIYDKRVKLAEECIKRNLNVDVYGHMWEYSCLKSNNIKGATHTKFNALDNYRFSIGVENSVIHNYITEKIYDILFFNTIPVYYGAPNLTTDLPDIAKHTIILNLQDIEDSISTIIHLNEDLYYEKIQDINKFKYSLFKNPTYSIWQKLINILT